MVDKDQRKEQRRNRRMGPSVEASATQKTSRVSRAAGSIGSKSIHVEQRSSLPATKPRASAQTTRKRAGGGKQATRKGSSPQRPPPAAKTPADSRLIGKA